MRGASSIGLWLAVVGLVRGLLPEHLGAAAAIGRVNAYQGLLPTYLYAFQFPVSTASATVDAPLLQPTAGDPDGRPSP